MFARTRSAALVGIQGIPVSVEVDIGGGLPCIEIIGLGDTAVKEARHRVRSAVRNSGYELPSRRIVVNLAPAGVHKGGSQLDLAIAVAILKACGVVRTSVSADWVLLGELSLDGGVRRTPGVLPMVLACISEGYRRVITSTDSRREVGWLEEAEIRTADTLRDVVDFLNGSGELAPARVGGGDEEAGGPPEADFADVRGQETVKRALEIAVSGGHNILLVGSPGSGKTMLARAVPSIMPELSPRESVEVTAIHSAAGLLPPDKGLVRRRPFRAPHHTATPQALVGGGNPPRPGEVTLAHRGVLFLDEMVHFSRTSLDALRQPLEEGIAVVNRAGTRLVFPASFLLLGASNPCPCGKFPSEECRCDERERRNYLSRLSGPLLDRFDMFCELSPPDVRDLDGPGGESSAAVRERVRKARLRQARRFSGKEFLTNSRIPGKELSAVVCLSRDARALLHRSFEKFRLSARSYHKILRVSLTIADLEESPRVEEEHVAEALSYRDSFLL